MVNLIFYLIVAAIHVEMYSWIKGSYPFSSGGFLTAQGFWDNYKLALVLSIFGVGCAGFVVSLIITLFKPSSLKAGLLITLAFAAICAFFIFNPLSILSNLIDPTSSVDLLELWEASLNFFAILLLLVPLGFCVTKMILYLDDRENR